MYVITELPASFLGQLQDLIPYVWEHAMSNLLCYPFSKFQTDKWNTEAQIDFTCLWNSYYIITKPLSPVYSLASSPVRVLQLVNWTEIHTPIHYIHTLTTYTPSLHTHFTIYTPSVHTHLHHIHTLTTYTPSLYTHPHHIHTFTTYTPSLHTHSYVHVAGTPPSQVRWHSGFCDMTIIISLTRVLARNLLPNGA